MTSLAPRFLAELESTAVELARLAAAEVEGTLGKVLAVEYKNLGAADASLKDPVSEVDRKVEALVRARLAESFPGHDILGEESEERPRRDSEFVWAIDPIDGTANFVNGFPLFAASIGVLHRQVPVAGAIWCSATHALRNGIYHARAGGGLRFEGAAFARAGNPAVRRWLAGDPEGRSPRGAPWEVRKTGSAAIECAFVAAGLLRVARFRAPHVWDVAAGIALVTESGGSVVERTAGRWNAFAGFDAIAVPGGSDADLRHWRRPLVIGEPQAVARLTESVDDGLGQPR